VKWKHLHCYFLLVFLSGIDVLEFLFFSIDFFFSMSFFDDNLVASLR